LQLTLDTYYTRNADLYYMSATQYKRFDECEAAAMAVLTGRYKTEPTPAMLVGSYVDAHFSGEMETFVSTHPEIFKRDGSLKAEFVQADAIIERINRDPMMRRYLGGQHQVIQTGKIAGVPFKTRIDSYHPGMAIVDLKVMRDFKPIWKNGQKLHWIEAWGYDIQGAIYQAIEGNKLPFIIAAASKEPVTDIELLLINNEHLAETLKEIKQKAQRFDAIKKGLIEPERCGRCDWCKQTKIITQVTNYELDDYFD
jgi:hypothetical protein